jgi:hypothetical protein
MSSNVINQAGEVSIPLTGGTTLTINADEGIATLSNAGGSVEVNFRDIGQSSYTLNIGGFSLTLVRDGATSMAFNHGVISGNLSLDSTQNVVSARWAVEIGYGQNYAGASVSLNRGGVNGWTGIFRGGIQVDGSLPGSGYINSNLFKEIVFDPVVQNPCTLLSLAGEGLLSNACQLLMNADKRTGSIEQLSSDIGATYDFAATFSMSAPLGCGGQGVVDNAGNYLVMGENAFAGCMDGTLFADPGAVAYVNPDTPFAELPDFAYLEIQTHEFGYTVHAIDDEGRAVWGMEYTPSSQGPKNLPEQPTPRQGLVSADFDGEPVVGNERPWLHRSVDRILAGADTRIALDNAAVRLIHASAQFDAGTGDDLPIRPDSSWRHQNQFFANLV